MWRRPAQWHSGSWVCGKVQLPALQQSKRREDDPVKKRIVCFGDSNTWGYDPVSGKRFDEDTRLDRAVAEVAGRRLLCDRGRAERSYYRQPGSLGVGDKVRHGLRAPHAGIADAVDVLVIMLGGNDLKRKFHLPAPDVAGSLQNMLLRVRSHLRVYLNSPQTRILVVAPVPIGEGIAKSRFAPFFDAEDALRQSRELARWYRLVAEQFGCAFFDAAEVAQPGEVDCLASIRTGT